MKEKFDNTLAAFLSLFLAKHSFIYMESLKIITSQYQFSKVRPCLVPAFQWVTLNDVEISTEKPQGVIQSYISLGGIYPSGKQQVINICAYPHTQCTHTCTQFIDMHADRPQQHITLPFVLFWLPASSTYFLSTLAFTFSFCFFLWSCFTLCKHTVFIMEQQCALVNFCF